MKLLLSISHRYFPFYFAPHHPITHSSMPVIHRTISLASTLSRDDIPSSGSVMRDPSREFSWEWEDRRTGLWHSLPEFISCFLEPASKTQSHGGVRTSKLTLVDLIYV